MGGRRIYEHLLRLRWKVLAQLELEKFSRSIGGYFKRQLNSLSNVSKAQLEVSPDVPEIPEFHTLVQILNDNSPKDNVSIGT